MAGDRTSQPLVVVIAGPNGAGKTTMSRRLLRGALAVSEFVNADTIAQGLSAFNPEAVAVEAGRIMLARLKELAEARADFAFETTLSGRAFAPWLRELRAAGYRSHLAFVSLLTPELAVARVALRVQRGGHNIPEGTVRRRHAAGLANFFNLYRDVVDSWQMFDNSGGDEPRLLASGERGQPETILDPAIWGRLAQGR